MADVGPFFQPFEEFEALSPKYDDAPCAGTMEAYPHVPGQASKPCYGPTPMEEFYGLASNTFGQEFIYKAGWRHDQPVFERDEDDREQPVFPANPGNGKPNLPGGKPGNGKPGCCVGEPEPGIDNPSPVPNPEAFSMMLFAILALAMLWVFRKNPT